jgi:hypothetical protein
MSKENLSFKPNYKNLEYAQQTFELLDDLSAECQNWEAAEHTTSKTRLYGLLGNIYGVYETKFVAAKNDDVRRTLRGQLVGKLKAAGIETRNSADLLGLLLRYVFKADRRRVNIYKNAILAARSHNVTPTDLSNWFFQEHGLEEVSLKKSPVNDKKKKRVDAIEAEISKVNQEIALRSEVPLATISLPVSAENSHVILLAEASEDGQFKILYLFDQPTESIAKKLVRQVANNSVILEAQDSAARQEAATFAALGSGNQSQKND